MIAAFCWVLIYVGRALEWVRLGYSTFWFESWPRRWTNRKVGSCYVSTAFGIAVLFPVAWMYGAAAWLTIQANRGLPPLLDEYGLPAGKLARLYPRRPAQNEVW